MLVYINHLVYVSMCIFAMKTDHYNFVKIYNQSIIIVMCAAL